MKRELDKQNLLLPVKDFYYYHISKYELQVKTWNVHSQTTTSANVAIISYCLNLRKDYF